MFLLILKLSLRNKITNRLKRLKILLIRYESQCLRLTLFTKFFFLFEVSDVNNERLFSLKNISTSLSSIQSLRISI